MAAALSPGGIGGVCRGGGGGGYPVMVQGIGGLWYLFLRDV